MAANEATKRNISPKIIRLAITGILLFWVINRVGFDQIIDALQDVDLRFIGISMLVFQVGVVYALFVGGCSYAGPLSKLAIDMF